MDKKNCGYRHSQAARRGRAGDRDQKRGLGMFRRSNGLKVKGDPWASGWPCWVSTDDICGCGERGRRPREEQQGVEGRCDLGFGQVDLRSRFQVNWKVPQSKLQVLNFHLDLPERRPPA